MADEERVTRVTGVGVLDRVVAILDAVERTPMGASELARELGLAVPTTHRLASAMVAHGLLRRGSDGRHHLGERFASSGLAGVAQPVLEELRRDTGESAQVWVRRGDYRLCLASADSDAELRASLPVGSLLPLSAGGSAARVLSGADPLDAEHPDRRWFESVSQRTPGLGSVSAPVRLHGEAVAAVCVSGPLSRMGPEGPGQFADQTVRAAERIGNVLRVR